MVHGPLRILQLSTTDAGGGAERVAALLAKGWRAAGHSVHTLVGEQRGTGAGVSSTRDVPAGVRATTAVASNAAKLFGLQGLGHFDSRYAIDRLGDEWDLVVGHNLHGGWFDLPLLRRLGQRTRLALALHDRWLTTGHCAHPLDSDRWRTGCGGCPNLDTYPAVRRDATAMNLRLKRWSLSDGDARLLLPCRWLEGIVAQTYLSALPRHVVPNPVDLEAFRPSSQRSARAQLGIDPERSVLFFPARLTASGFKDARTVLAALRQMEHPPLLLTISGGELDPAGLDVREVPATADDGEMALRYACADVVANVTIADTAPLVPLEAAACGRPSVVTDTGGAAEHLGPGSALVPPGSPTDLASALGQMGAERGGVSVRDLRDWVAPHAVDTAAALWLAAATGRGPAG